MSDKQQDNSTPRGKVSRQQVAKLFLVPLLMFGFGFALVPLYDVFCEVTGLNGKTGRVEASALDPRQVDASRTVTVKFIAVQGNGLPWSFEPMVREMEVHPGRIYESAYRVANRSARKTAGQAVPSVSPTQASLHFSKTECFCFSRQELEAGETREMPLRFVINHELPREIEEVTLSYTFFDVAAKQG
jgi:cytochrome c oxidase assembly protein subunit 11